MKTRERERRDSAILIILILLLGFICIILASGWALRFAPGWKLNTNMESHLNPNSDFLTSRPVSFVEPLDPAILTNPAWINVFLTPGASIQTRTPSPTNTSTSVPQKTSTPIPTIPATNTPTLIANPTNTLIFFPPTNTPKPNTPVPPSTNTPVTPLPSADLQITKTDGSLTYTAGTAITYTIVVSNAGPSNAIGVSVADAIPASITGTTINCVASGTASCGTNASAGNNLSYTGVNIPVGAGNLLTVTVSGTVNPAMTGNLVNTATVTAGVGQTDSIPGNNSATDTDTQFIPPSADLQITKTDGSLTYTAGTAITYTIVVSNAGPSNAIGVSVADAIPASITGTTINCVASGTASCGTNASAGNNLSYTGVNIPVGAGNLLTVTVSGTVNPAMTGNLVNTAIVTVGTGQTDPIPGNNSATDTDTQFIPSSADLQIANTDNATTYAAGISVQYTIVVSNPTGPSAITGATVSDTFSANLTGITWTCTGAGGAACTANGAGNINDTVVNLPVGSSVTYTGNATVIAAPAGDLVNTATVSVPVGTTDPNPGNNSATDTDTLIVTDPVPPEIGIGTPPDGNIYALVEGNTLTLALNLVANGDAGYDLVYYERPAGTGIFLDMITIQIGDGTNWYTVFNWGDNNPDANTNVDFNFLPNPQVPPEPDEREIPSANLYNLTGIAIDIDSIVPPGTYSYIRFFAPPDGNDNQTEIDGIEILP